MKKLATGWERAFQERLPKALDTYVGNARDLLHAFHGDIAEQAQETGFDLGSPSMLQTQIETYEELLGGLGTKLVAQMTELQREANRDFAPTIAEYMWNAYDMCVGENGKGSYKRMKDHMTDHVDHERHTMFHKAIESVEHHLQQMMKALQGSMELKAVELLEKLQSDYKQAFGCAPRVHPSMLQSAEERALRSDIRDMLDGVDAQFEDIATGNLGSGAEPNGAEDPPETHSAPSEVIPGAAADFAHGPADPDPVDTPMGGMDDANNSFHK